MSKKPDPNISDSSEDDEDYVPAEAENEEDDEKDEEFDEELDEDVDNDLMGTSNCLIKKDKHEKNCENTKAKDTDNEKKRIDLLWDDFLDDKPSTTANNIIHNETTNISEKKDDNKNPCKRTTLSQVANILSSKKKKMSVLDKTNNDWKVFVQREGIQEDLNQHGRSKDAYIERQEFLLKADYCEFEKEKALRNFERKK